MAKIIDFEDSRKDDDNLICRKPLEFRRGDWRQGHILQCLKSEAEKYQDHRRQAISNGHSHIRFVPEHFSLVGGCDYTVMGLFRWRENEELAREFYRLAGLMECVVNSTSPLLRTDLLRSLYKTILELKKSLNFSWKGDSSQFLLPLHENLYRRSRFFDQILQANTLKALYKTLDREIGIQFDLLAAEYVFYLPKRMTDEPA
ncbi:MAG: hypothetical protein P8017_04295 [Deltaproteobacteria bacterium]